MTCGEYQSNEQVFVDHAKWPYAGFNLFKLIIKKFLFWTPKFGVQIPVGLAMGIVGVIVIPNSRSERQEKNSLENGWK